MKRSIRTYLIYPVYISKFQVLHTTTASQVREVGSLVGRNRPYSASPSPKLSARLSRGCECLSHALGADDTLLHLEQRHLRRSVHSQHLRKQEHAASVGAIWQSKQLPCAFAQGTAAMKRAACHLMHSSLAAHLHVSFIGKELVLDLGRWHTHAAEVRKGILPMACCLA